MRWCWPGCYLVLVVHVEHLLLDLEVGPADQQLSYTVLLLLLEQFASDSFAHLLTGGVSVGYIEHCLQVPGHLEVLLDGCLGWDGLVEDVLLELSQYLLVLLPLQAFVLPQVHVVWEDQVHAPVVVGVVVVLVGDAIDALQLVGVPCGYDYLLGVLVAVPLTLCPLASICLQA